MTNAAVWVRGAFFTPRPPPSSIRVWQVVRAASAHDGRCGDRAFTLPLGPGRTAIVMVDVAGHGATRAPLASAIAGAITAELLGGASPAAALGCADDRLRRFADESPYAVAFVALVHPALRTVVYASAGHDVAFTLAEDGRLRHLGPTAPMLGVPYAVHVCDAVLSLDAGETLVIVTDGVADSRPAGSDDFFGAERTACAVARSLRRGGDPARGVLDVACAHAGGRQTDDIGVVVARIVAAGGAGAAKHPSPGDGILFACEDLIYGAWPAQAPFTSMIRRSGPRRGSC